jgi:hypothetical protein
LRRSERVAIRELDDRGPDTRLLNGPGGFVERMLRLKIQVDINDKHLPVQMPGQNKRLSQVNVREFA